MAAVSMFLELGLIKTFNIEKEVSFFDDFLCNVDVYPKLRITANRGSMLEHTKYDCFFFYHVEVFNYLLSTRNWGFPVFIVDRKWHT